MTPCRLIRLFHPLSRRCIGVVIDRSFSDEFAFLEGIEDIGRARRHAVERGADGIVYARTTIQHANLAAFAKTLMRVVPEGLGVDDARALLAV